MTSIKDIFQTSHLTNFPLYTGRKKNKEKHPQDSGIICARYCTVNEVRFYPTHREFIRTIERKSLQYCTVYVTFHFSTTAFLIPQKEVNVSPIFIAVSCSCHIFIVPPPQTQWAFLGLWCLNHCAGDGGFIGGINQFSNPTHLDNQPHTTTTHQQPVKFHTDHVLQVQNQLQNKVQIRSEVSDRYVGTYIDQR